MRVLVLGSGGREHALAWKLVEEGNEVVVAPGNAGIGKFFECVELDLLDRMRLLELANSLSPDLIVIGPEDPLIRGLADMLRENGFATFGPGADGARLEGSKAFSKDLMRQGGVPTADFQAFSNSDSAREYVQKQFAEGKEVAVKASGAALGKGVVVCSSEEEALEAVSFMMDEAKLGESGKTVVIEERLKGREFSLLTLVSEGGIWSLPVAQDYKQIGDGDSGPNTGGMGTYSPVSWLDAGVVARTEEAVVRPILKVFGELGVGYRGVLFSGLMVDGDNVRCLEYNVRFGDPETQSVMRRLGSGFGESMLAVANGGAPSEVSVLDQAAVTVVAASAGYPGSYEKGVPLTVGSMPMGTEVFYAGVSGSGDGLVTSGGRVLGVSAVGPTLELARAAAYEGLGRVSFEGMTARSDIALS